MKKLLENFIKAWKPLFDLHPELKAIPVYAWGRYYKYECAGNSFADKPYLDGGDFMGFIKGYSIDYAFQIDLLTQIDKEYEEVEEFEFGEFFPRRSTVARVFDFDERAGKCLVLAKENDTFKLILVDCDSPE